MRLRSMKLAHPGSTRYALCLPASSGSSDRHPPTLMAYDDRGSVGRGCQTLRCATRQSHSPQLALHPGLNRGEAGKRRAEGIKHLQSCVASISQLMSVFPPEFTALGSPSTAVGGPHCRSIQPVQVLRRSSPLLFYFDGSDKST